MESQDAVGNGLPALSQSGRFVDLSIASNEKMGSPISPQ